MPMPESVAMENAAMVKAELELALDGARTMAQALSAYEGVPGGQSQGDL